MLEDKQTIYNLTSRLLDEEQSLILSESHDQALNISVPKANTNQKLKPVSINPSVVCYNWRNHGNIA